MMTTAMINSQINELNELEAMLEELKAEADTIKDTLKAEMDDRGVEELDTGIHVIRYTSVLSQRFDTTSFKKDYKEVYKHYLKQITSKRFSIC